MVPFFFVSKALKTASAHSPCILAKCVHWDGRNAQKYLGWVGHRQNASPDLGTAVRSASVQGSTRFLLISKTTFVCLTFVSGRVSNTVSHVLSDALLPIYINQQRSVRQIWCHSWSNILTKQIIQRHRHDRPSSSNQLSFWISTSAASISNLVAF